MGGDIGSGEIALAEGRIAVAERLLREHLKQHPTDVPAIRMLAEVAGIGLAWRTGEGAYLPLAPGESNNKNGSAVRSAAEPLFPG